VIDITDANAAEQAEAVEQTLTALHVADKPRLTVLNKVDRLTTPMGQPVACLADAVTEVDEDEAHDDVALVSAERGWGLDELRARMAATLPEYSRNVVGPTGAPLPAETPVGEQRAAG